MKNKPQHFACHPERSEESKILHYVQDDTNFNPCNAFPTLIFLFYYICKKKSDNFLPDFYSNIIYFPNIASNPPAATAEPITPATFGPIACMRR